MSVNGNQEGTPNYYPNSFSGPEPSQRALALEPAVNVSGDVNRYDSGDEENFTQPRIFWNSVLDEAGRNRLVFNIARHLGDSLEFIQQRAVQNFAQVNPDFGRKLKIALHANEYKQRGQRRV